MEYQHKLLIATGILVAIAIYIVLTLPAAETGPDSAEAEALLLKSAGFGKGLGDYVYSYSELSDGYTTSYALVVNGGEREAEVQNPLSVKNIYILENDTIFCIRYPPTDEEICSSVKGDAEMENYVAFIQSKFFSDSNIAKAESNIAYLIEKGYLSVMPEIEDDIVSTVPCRRISYTIDYSNLSLDEAARFGISSGSPRVFMLSACVQNETGMVRESTLEYLDNGGVMHTKITTLSSFSDSSTPISAPEPNGDAVAVLRKEREQQIKLVACHTDKEGAEKEDCVADLSLILKRKDLCELAGSLRDRCMVTLVPIIKDETICPEINSPSFRDDCYIELAGAYKNSTYCSSIQNQSKIEHCEEVSVPKNETESDYDIDEFLNYIDDYDGDTGENTTGDNESAG